MTASKRYEKYGKPIKPEDPDTEYLTIQETAYVMKCSVRWLRDGVNLRGFPHSIQGRRIVFNRADRAYIYELQRVAPTPIKRAARRKKTQPKPEPQAA